MSAAFASETALKCLGSVFTAVTFDAIPGFSTASFRGRTAWIKESRGSAIIGVELIELGGGPIDKEFLELLEYYSKKLP